MSTFDDIIRNAMADFEGQACLPCNLEALPAASPNNQLNTSDSNNVSVLRFQKRQAFYLIVLFCALI
jgi:hypothetical protein